jgi:hypothetical protein
MKELVKEEENSADMYGMIIVKLSTLVILDSRHVHVYYENFRA